MIPGVSATLDSSLAYVQGDTWGGIPGITILVNGSPPAANVSVAKMQFRPTQNSADTLIELSSTDATISITSAANWTFVVPAQELDLQAGVYAWAFQTEDVGGVLQTYLQGSIQVIPKGVYA